MRNCTIGSLHKILENDHIEYRDYHLCSLYVLEISFGLHEEGTYAVFDFSIVP
jgi:hypothetical protein